MVLCIDMSIDKLFNKGAGIVIGALHLSPSPDYPDSIPYEKSLKNALFDAHALEAGGADAIIYENNYDIPHLESVSPTTKDFLTKIGKAIKSSVTIPVGISVLWNDYKTALEVAKELELSFIRIPVFVDTVKTKYGIFSGNPQEVLEFRKSINAEHVALFTDIHVKHSEILSTDTIEESAQKAIAAGADALIVTGKWTGDAPDLTELKRLRTTVGTFPILCGSGVDAQNINHLFEYANGAIVSTSLKEESSTEHTENVRPYESRIATIKVTNLIKHNSLNH